MGSLLSNDDGSISELELSHNNIIIIDEDKMMHGSFTWYFNYHPDIKDDCYRLITEAKEHKRNFVICYDKDKVIHSIRFADDYLSYNSKQIVKSSYGYYLK